MTEKNTGGSPDEDEMDTTEGSAVGPMQPPDDEEWSADENDVEEEAEEEESGEDDGEEDEEATSQQEPSRVYLPGDAEDAEKNGDLVCDESAYQLYHTCGTLLPCLSFDVIPDNLGNDRTTYPATCYCIAGSQAEKSNKNSLLVMKFSNLTGMKPAPQGSDDEDDSADDSDEDESPELECAQIRHIGAVNRIKFARVNNQPLAASFSETGRVHLWNLTNAIRAVEDSRFLTNFQQNSPDFLPFFSFQGHKREGFALCWSKVKEGQLASGDLDGNIYVWKPSEAGQWRVEQSPYKSHTSSVEDIQWSPNEPNVFASCSSDKSIKIWDIRQKPGGGGACMMTSADAHTEDVNVIHWNPTEPFIVSGSDAGDIKIWDLRRFATGSGAVAVFRHHRAPISSVEWHPSDSTVFAAAGEDNQLTQWDISLERGEDEPTELDAVPPQLLFIHQGQTEIKELHWHPQMPGVVLSSALNGIDIFKTISV